MSDTSKQTKAIEKKELQQAILERAKRIQAARKTAEAQKAIAERKERMARRAEAKKRAEALRETKKTENTSKEQINVYTIKEDKHNEDEYIEISITARKYKTLPTKKFLLRKFWINPSAYIIQSYIPGTIISIFAKEGKVVKEGTPLLILEAMKMQNTVEMPFTARIEHINVSVGQKVPKEHILIELSAI